MNPIQHAHRCSDGGTEAHTANGFFDAAALTGTSVITYPVACPEDSPGGLTVQFSLTKVG
jgi:hypothetical protein